MNKCSKCETYKQELEKYKERYELAKSGLSDSEREILIELICNEQLRHLIPKADEGYESKRYNLLEKLKAKVRVV